MLFNAIVGMKFDADWFEQEELVVVGLRWIRCKNYEVGQQLLVWLLECKCKSDIMSTAQVRNKQKYDKKTTEMWKRALEN
jgi:hypothetical protein